MNTYAVRDGKQVTPTCPECGCRLKFHNDGVWGHYIGPTYPDGSITHDAKGHRCSMVVYHWVLGSKGLFGGGTAMAQ